MITSVTLNAIMQLGFVICVLYCIGDYDTVAASGLPLIEIYYSATKSKAASTVLVLMHGSIFVVSLLNIFASVSRLVWAFARDKGLPFSHFFTYVSSLMYSLFLRLTMNTQVHPTLQIPIPALALIAVCCGLLALVNIGSTVAFTALVSLPTVALYISYFIPIFLLVLRKLAGKHPQYGPFKLGRWGLPINIISLLYIVYILIWTPFPPARPVTAETMNYAGPITIAIILIALADWFSTGKKRFKVPTGSIVIPDEHEMDDQSSNGQKKGAE